MSQRTDRIDELLRQEIGGILSREVKDPRIGFATVTKVETTPDLRHALVWVSVIGDQAERTATIRVLDGVLHFVRRELGPRLRLKRIPDLHVRLDDTAERGTRVLHLLEELEAGRIPEDEPVSGETLPTPGPRIEPGPEEGGSVRPIAGPKRTDRRERSSAGGSDRRPGGRPASRPPAAGRERTPRPSPRPRRSGPR